MKRVTAVHFRCGLSDDCGGMLGVSSDALAIGAVWRSIESGSQLALVVRTVRFARGASGILFAMHPPVNGPSENLEI